MLNADTREFQFTSDHDGLIVSAVIAAPSGNINGIVQIVHGMNEYKERYFPFMDYLAEEGFITVIHDNRGHGKSICTPDDLGFMFRAGGKGFVSDIAQLNAIVKQRFPDLPCFLIGHSMGSLGARCFLKEHDDQINGLIVLGCPCYSRFSGFVRSIDSSLSKKLGSRYRSDKIYDIAEKTLGRNFPGPPHSWICSDKEVVEKFNADPLCNFRYTLNGYEGLLWLMRETYSKKGWQVKSPSLPIRFISGKDDPVMLSEKKFFKAMESLEKAGYSSISHRFFDGMRHEVLNEKNAINVYKDIAKTLFSWIDRIRSTEYVGETSAFPTPEEIMAAAVPEPAPSAAPEPPLPAEAVMEEKKQAAANAQAEVMQLLNSVAPAPEKAPEEAQEN